MFPAATSPEREKLTTPTFIGNSHSLNTTVMPPWNSFPPAIRLHNFAPRGKKCLRLHEAMATEEFQLLCFKDIPFKRVASSFSPFMKAPGSEVRPLEPNIYCLACCALTKSSLNES